MTTEEEARETEARKATTAAGRLEYHLLDQESVTFYPYWAADLRAVIAASRVSTPPSNDDIRLATLAAVKRGARSDSEAVRNYREAERIIRAAIPHLGPAPAATEPEEKR